MLQCYCIIIIDSEYFVMHDEEQSKKKKRFKLFDSQREGKGVTKEQANLPPNLKKFFIIYRRDFSRLLSVNMLLVLGNFPVFFLLIALSGLLTVDFATPAVGAYPLFGGLLAHTGTSASSLALGGILGAQATSGTYMPLAYVFFGLSLFTFFTFGLVNTGVAYILRNMVKGDPVFVWADFWHAVKTNLKQGFLFGIADLLILILIPFNILHYSTGSGFFNGILFWVTIVLGIVYLAMRRYIYLQMVTFSLKFTKILKNALIFSILGFKRNALAFLGVILLCLITLLCAYSGVLFSLAIAIPLVILFSHASYMTTYAAFFKIKELMIDPYYKDLEAKNKAQAEG